MNNDQYFLLFKIGVNYYALAASQINELIEYQLPTYLPNVSNHIKGLLNLRGTVLPVIDLSVLLNTAQTNRTKSSCIIISEVIIQDKASTLGLLVDQVLDLIEISTQQLAKADKLASTINPDLIEHVFIHSEKIVTVLNLEQVFKYSNQK